MAAVTLIDVERQWFKSIQGIDAAENLRSESMCGHAILQPQEIMVVEDALQDIRFHDNPVVTGDPHIRFYAGAPLISSDGLPLGTLCVFDAHPQHLASDKAEALAALSRQVMLVDRKSTRLNSSHSQISYAVFCLKKKNMSSTHVSFIRQLDVRCV